MILLYIYGFHCLLGFVTYIAYRQNIEFNVDRLYPIKKEQEPFYHFLIGFFVTFLWILLAMYALYQVWKVKDKK